MIRRFEFGAAVAIADEAVKIGQGLVAADGIANEDAAARVKAGGLLVVMDASIGARHALLRIPSKSVAARD